MIVMKFGGTSNKDAAAIRNVIGIVTAHLARKPIVVISAIAKATNELELAARTAALGKRAEAESVIEALVARHRSIVHSLLLQHEHIASLEQRLTQSQEEIGHLIEGVSILRELTPRTLDAFCSFGERLSSSIVSAGLQEAGVNAVWVDAKEFMVTDDNYGHAYPLTGKVRENLATVVRPLMESGHTPVTQGFIGVTESGAYTTMGRESSDFSASIIGAAMNAELVQIWTDVDGILTADPRIVNDARQVRRMSFDEAFELSYFGAKVLHPNTMLPLFENNIPVEVRNSSRSTDNGTRLDQSSSDKSTDDEVKSIAFQKGVALVRVRPARRINPYLFWEGVFSILSHHNIKSGATVTSESCIACSIPSGSDMQSLKHEMEEFGVVQFKPGKGSVTLVGRGVGTAVGLTERIFRAIASIPLAMVSYGASDLSVTLIIEESRVEEAVNLLHAEFF